MYILCTEKLIIILISILWIHKPRSRWSKLIFCPIISLLFHNRRRYFYWITITVWIVYYVSHITHLTYVPNIESFLNIFNILIRTPTCCINYVDGWISQGKIEQMLLGIACYTNYELTLLKLNINNYLNKRMQ